MDKSIKDILEHMACTPKRQRGNAYGIGDDINSEEHVAKNIPAEMLDDPDATLLKTILVTLIVTFQKQDHKGLKR